MGLSRQEYWSGVPFPAPGDLPEPGIQPTSPASPALAGGFFTASATWEHVHRLYADTTSLYLGTWAPVHFGTQGSPGTSPLRIPRDTCTSATLWKNLERRRILCVSRDCVYEREWLWRFEGRCDHMGHFVGKVVSWPVPGDSQRTPRGFPPLGFCCSPPPRTHPAPKSRWERKPLFFHP